MENSTNYVVYEHRNNLNGKVYIGITDNIEERWSGCGAKYKSCSAFYNAIKKYGWDGFTHTVLRDGLSFDEAVLAEKEFIAQNRSNVSRYGNASNGYNLTDGGEGIVGYHHSDETRCKIGDILRNPSSETRAKMSQASKGRQSWLGKTHTAETLAKMSESAKRRGPTRVKHILCVDTGTVFNSVADAAREMGINGSYISGCCRGRYASAKGFRFRYVPEEEVTNG